MFLNYQDKGSGAPIMLLHGWGGSSKSLAGLADFLVNGGYRVINVDLPGFGESEMPERAYGMNDFVGLIHDLIVRLELRKPVVVGHSFGGQIAMFLAMKYPSLISKIVLVNASGIKPKETLRTRVSFVMAKVGNVISWVPPFIFFRRAIKWVFYRYIVGELDYYQSGNMKATFKRITHERINLKLSEINCEALVIWGKDDKITPLWQGEKLAKGIKRSRLEVIENIGHGLPLKYPQIVAELILKFMD